ISKESLPITYPIMHALAEYGVFEYKNGSNPEVEKYIKSCNGGNNLNDETPWCSGFVNWCAKQAGASHTDSLSARSWLKIANVPNNPQVGDVVILWRGESDDGVAGHVGFYVSKNEDGTINILGGNQSDKVTIQTYPQNRILGYRRIW